MDGVMIKMDEEEIKILNKLYDEKNILSILQKIIVTRKFYNYIQRYTGNWICRRVY